MKKKYINPIFLIVLSLLSTACAKGNNEFQKTGIIVNRDKMPVEKTTQISVDFTKIESSAIDTSLHFNKHVCDSLDKHLNYVKKKGNYKGLSLAVAVPGKGFWKSTTGESGTSVPLTANTKFHALSMGKIFTSAIILKLAEDNLLKLDDTIEKWFPQCSKSNEITINHLLNHTSGIQTYEVLYEYRLHNNSRFTEQNLVEMALGYDINNAPGSFFSYSNSGYIMLGIIINKVSGKSLEQVFYDYLINPLNLRNTQYCNAKNLDMENIRGYSNGEISENAQWPLTYAAGPLISTPTEILLLYNYLLSGNFLNTESMNRMLSHMNLWLKNPNTYYGKGIYSINGLPSGSYLGHAGGDDCFRTCVFYNTKHNVFISIFSNTDTNSIEPAMFFISEKLIDLLK
jgi:D-alanyl-D-alanine carboxypeptidase